VASSLQEVHDEAPIEGSRIIVRHVYERVHGRGLRPETVAERYTLDIADVYHALAYYHEHPEEMREVERRRDEAIKSAREKTTITPPDE
jgi:uncharacterized protein (DUF433 family)